MESEIRFVENPDLNAEEVAALRKAVGWDGRVEKLKKILGNTFISAGCFYNGRLVGYVDVVSDAVDDAYIRNLMVHPEYQGRGIGSELISTILRRIKREGIKMANVLFEPHLVDFYRKCGFTIMAGGVIDNEKKQ
ncbi:MAG: GNAT family N-acetyltransferase [Deltaproteobacteria bacterium]|nr:GNAT family N-acetyltransferase [Deltaproteobacteria bacterium]